MLFLLAGCHYTRHLSEEQQLLWENEILLSSGNKPNYKASSILKQQPNPHFAFVSPNLFFYNLGNGKDSSFTTRIGSKPIILNKQLSVQGAEQLENYYFNKGYFQSRASHQIVPLGGSKYQKAKVQYRVQLGPRFTIDSVSRHVKTPHVYALLKYFSERWKVHAGQPFDADILNAEREWITDMLKNHGYYNFQETYIRYELDTVTAQGKHGVNLKLIIDDVKKDSAGESVMQHHRRYQIDEIVIQPDYDFSDPPQGKDSLYHNDYLYVYDSLRYRPRYVTDALHFAPGDVYQQSSTEESYSHIASYDGFSITEITYQPLPAADTGKGKLQANVRLVPLSKRSLTFETEITTTSGNYGINGSAGIVNRNLFKGGEALSFALNGGLEFQPTFGGSNIVSRTLEMGASLTLDIPRMLLPFNTEGLFPKRIFPKTSLSLEVSNTQRQEFQRLNSLISLQYRWRQRRFKTHQLDLINLSFSDLSVDNNSNFFRALDPIQQLAFQSEFITALRYTFTFNNQPFGKRHSYYWQFKGETSGNVINALQDDLNIGGTTDINTAEDREPVTTGSVFGVPLYQYTRLEGEFRYYFRFDDKHLLANRIYSGYIHAYGNSNLETENGSLRIPPFSRFFFLGGTNDLRAWPAFRSGGGQQLITDYAGSNNGFSIGTIKFLASTEYRFPIISSLKGALFIDAGNIWLSGGLENAQNGFALDEAFNQLYIGAGPGLRFDLDYFVIRFDVGVKIRDPGLLNQGSPWVLNRFAPRNFTYNFALGYPF